MAHRLSPDQNVKCKFEAKVGGQESRERGHLRVTTIRHLVTQNLYPKHYTTIYINTYHNHVDAADQTHTTGANPTTAPAPVAGVSSSCCVSSSSSSPDASVGPAVGMPVGTIDEIMLEPPV